ncbi:hypothetical protein [Telmatospirillum siberiense]|uniref:Uncharacterized protein n=1 Tax=Telmatospirillum siberiense TaxID=382514 RepID=A0A2N3PRH4_9PROT|nr:hypothetical protein [Telmatospirillum siberiense]PKU23010.1 hypothetical protein CWS72_18385 [Telmatospirillum siberiense]
MDNPFAGFAHGTRHLVIKWQLLATAAGLTMLGIAFLAVAADLWLADRIGPPAAAAVTAGLLILMALAVVGIAAIVTACRPKAVSRERAVDPAGLAETAATLIDLCQKLDCEIRTSVKPLTIAALVIGCAVGYSPLLQRKLKDLIS